MTKEEEFLIEMKNFFENIDKLKLDLEKQISETEKARNDLLHELELGNLNAIEIMKVAKTLKEVLQERRQYKDELKKVMTLKGFTDKYNNKLIVGDIIQALKNLKTLQKQLEERKYRPRMITNLKCVEEETKECQ
ncbi:MAG: hypothetical protein IKF17_05640 [Clostridia bacterium]|nr:hypothetical protein [Clostridia bacterium]